MAEPVSALEQQILLSLISTVPPHTPSSALLTTHLAVNSFTTTTPLFDLVILKFVTRSAFESKTTPACSRLATASLAVSACGMCLNLMGTTVASSPQTPRNRLVAWETDQLLSAELTHSLRRKISVRLVVVHGSQSRPSSFRVLSSMTNTLWGVLLLHWGLLGPSQSSGWCWRRCSTHRCMSRLHSSSSSVSIDSSCSSSSSLSCRISSCGSQLFCVDFPRFHVSWLIWHAGLH